MKKIAIRIVTMGLFAMMFGASLINLLSVYADRSQAEQEYAQLEELVTSAPATTVDEPEQPIDESSTSVVEDTQEEETAIVEEVVVPEFADESFPEVEVDCQGFEAVNDDFVGFLLYEDADIHLPVVQEDEEDEYLHKTFQGFENPAGCTFIFNDADAEFNNSLVVYGHNMKNGSMFGSLFNVNEKRDNPYFYVYTEDGAKKYRVISAYTCEASDPDVYQMPSDEDYDAYLQRALENGRYDDVVEFTDREMYAMEQHAPIVTLSTCHGAAGTTTRFVVSGILIAED